MLQLTAYYTVIHRLFDVFETRKTESIVCINYLVQCKTNVNDNYV